MKKPAGFFSTLIITSLVCLIGTAHALSLSTPPVSDRGAGFDNVNGVAGPLASDNDGLLRVFGYTGSFYVMIKQVSRHNDGGYVG